VSRHATSIIVTLLVAISGCKRTPTPSASAGTSQPAVSAAGADPAAEPAAPAASGPAVESEAGVALAAAAGAPASRVAAADAWAASGAGETAASGSGAPFLWRVEGAKPVYLFGTIHVPDERVLALNPAVEKAFQQATAVYTEIPMDASTQMAVMGRIMLPDDQKLSDIVGDRLYARMNAQVEKSLAGTGGGLAGAAGLLTTMFERMKPWAAMSQLSLIEFLPDLAAGRQPLDAMLYARAQQEGKTVGALETPEEQLAVFESFTMAEQTRMLELTVQEMEKHKPGEPSQSAALVEAYLSGDMGQVQEKIDEAMEGDRALMARFRTTAIDQRNTRMADRIQALRRKQPDTVFFFAVGTAHYAGPTGIVAQLEKAGLKVTRVR